MGGEYMTITDKIPTSKRVLFADLDGTLIETQTGNPFPCGIWDMKLKLDVLDCIRACGFEILLIATNQGGIELGYVDEKHFCKGKMNYIQLALAEYLGIPVEYDYCKHNDKTSPYRKPNTGMLNNMCRRYLPKHNITATKEEMLLLGDASGTPTSWSDTDIRTAENFGIDYVDVNTFMKIVDL